MKKNQTRNTFNPIKPSQLIERQYQSQLLKILFTAKSKVKNILTGFKEARAQAYFVELIASKFKQAIETTESELVNLANEIARDFADKSLDAVDRRLKNEFKISGFNIDFIMTQDMQAKISAKIAENVSLITNLPAQYLDGVQGVVMRSIENGTNLEMLNKELVYRYGISKKRASLIARDQTIKANMAFNRQRQIDAGITTAVWVHSGLGVEKRHSHVKAGKDKLEFDLQKGALIDGEYIMPGQLINCRCTWRAKLFNE